MSESIKVELVPQVERTEVPPPNTEVHQGKLTRKRFLKGAVVAGLSLVLGSRLLPKDSFPLGESDVVEKIEVFEAEVGGRELDFNEVKSYLPLIATLFAKSFDQDPNEIIDRTFILRKKYGGTEPEDYGRRRFGYDDVFKAPDIQQLLSDYPRLKLSIGEAKSILNELNRGMSVAFVLSGGKIILVYGRMLKESYLDGTTRQQYLGIGDSIICEEETFITGLRSIYFHELTHGLVRTEWRSLNKELMESYGRVEDEERKVMIARSEAKFGPRSSKELSLEDEITIIWKDGSTKGFKIVLDGEFSRRPIGNKEYNWRESKLDELITSYIAAQVSVRNGLPYSYSNSTELANIDIVLKESAISFDELVDLYRSSRLQDFLLKVARGAKNIDSQNENEMLDFAIKNFLFGRKDSPESFGDIDWKTLSEYFPGVISVIEKVGDDITIRRPSCLA